MLLWAPALLGEPPFPWASVFPGALDHRFHAASLVSGCPKEGQGRVSWAVLCDNLHFMLELPMSPMGKCPMLEGPPFCSPRSHLLDWLGADAPLEAA